MMGTLFGSRAAFTPAGIKIVEHDDEEQYYSALSPPLKSFLS